MGMYNYKKSVYVWIIIKFIFPNFALGSYVIKVLKFRNTINLIFLNGYPKRYISTFVVPEHTRYKPPFWY